MNERSINDIFQDMYDKRIKIGLGATGSPIRRVNQWIGDILGHTEYEKFWDEILDNDPSKKGS